MPVAVVAEKPSVARDLARVLGATQRGDGVLTGNGYVVTWAIGHLVGLAEPEGIRPEWKRWSRETLPMLPAHWPLQVLEHTRAQFAIVKRVINAADIKGVVCATDAGREGELIFRFIYEAAECRKPVKRLWISSLTDGAIKDGFAKLRPSADFDPLADAALGRSRADWLVGMNLSRAYGIALDAPLSVGRVQTPTLALIVERELAIRRFVPEDYLEVVATFSPRDGASYAGTWHRPGTVEHPKRLPFDGVEAKAVVERAKTGTARIASVTQKTKKQPPPQLYDLTELQRHTNRLYGFSAAHTLEVAQALYEKHKVISYPRTDSRHLSTEIAGTLRGVTQAIRAPYEDKLAPGTGERALSRRFVDDAQVSDHHAIIPTTTTPHSLNADERRVYELICRRLLQAWHDDFTWAATEVVTEIASPSVIDTYKSHGTAIEQQGWKVLDIGAIRPPKEKGAVGEDDDAVLPSGLVKGQPQKVLDAKSVAKRTRPPPRLTEATLLTAMETAGKTLDERELSEAMKENGLGTPATRAATIETLLSRQYIARDGKTLNATDKGIALIEVVDPDVKSAAMTGAWEARLQRIAKRQGSLPEFMKGIEAYVESVVGRIDGRNMPRAAFADSRPPRPPPSGDRSFGGSSQVRSTADRVSASSAREHTARSTQSAFQLSTHGSGANAAPTAGATHSAMAETSGQSRSVVGSTADRSEQLRSHGGTSVDRASASSTGSSTSQLQQSNSLASNVAMQRGHQRGVVVPPSALPALLRARFGFERFRPHQQAACEAAAGGEDVLLVMPTGAGKSLCYQLPGLARGGTTLVVSPLIALMDDQVAALQAKGLRAERIHSGRGRVESRRVCAEYLAGELDYLFIAPERLGVAGFPELLAKRTPSLIAIDEAHCISQWGHDFRPDYRLLGARLPSLRPAPVMALTATATPIVQQDIVKQLGLRASAKQLIHGFRRTNLAIEVAEVVPSGRVERCVDLLEKKGRLPAIVYAPTRKSAEAAAKALGRRFRAAPYHAGLSPDVRATTQTDFLDGHLDVVVATIAFGMGVDKPNVRTVVHLALPGSVEAYYQEIGRAGRDGLPSRVVLLQHFVDRKTHEFFLERDYPDEAVLKKIARALSDEPQAADAVQRRSRIAMDDFEKALEKLWIHGGVTGVTEDALVRGHDRWAAPYAEQRRLRVEQLALVARFAESNRCRMVSLVKHFGDQADSAQPCGLCDVCAPAQCLSAVFETPTAEELRVMSQVLAKLKALPGQSSGRLCRELLGEAPEERPKFERLIGGLVRAGQLRTVDDVFEKDGQRIPFVRLYPLGEAAPEKVRLPMKSVPVKERVFREKKKRRRAAREPRTAAVELPQSGAAAGLVETLRTWRLAEAKRRRVPAFRVLTNRALVAVATTRPATLDALRGLEGVGPKVVKDSGAAILALLRR